ncbi:MAG TPA: hypothetical protein VKV20_05860 [Ktedonobacteraceae bacterium]|nr:hypothetical protein [Ktedonobacteraceae bacterium]
MNRESQNYTVWIEAEEWTPGEWTPDDDNTDVIVTREDGSRWAASFFSYKNIATLTEKNRKTGECLSGACFWASNMILIDRVSRQRIEEVIGQFIAENQFEAIFRRIPSEESQES